MLTAIHRKGPKTVKNQNKPQTFEPIAIPVQSIPKPDEIEVWLLELPPGNSVSIAKQTIGLMRGINLHQIPPSQHLATLAVALKICII